jgi:hypothetical protein
LDPILSAGASCSQQQPEQNPRPDAAAAIDLIRRHFLNRTDVVAYAPPTSWGWKIDACPTQTGDNLDALLRAHLQGMDAPAVQARWTTKTGKPLAGVGRFRLGTYSPAADGTTVYGCVDFDGGGRHGHPLAMPLEVAWKVWLRLLLLGLEAHLEKSGGGKGWHVWVFFDRPVSAADVRRLLFSVVPQGARLADGGLADAKSNKGIEVFPKQDALPADGGVGNLIWLPWWHAAPEGANLFYRYDASGELKPYAPAELAVVTADALARALALPRPEAPARNGDGRHDMSDRELGLEALRHLSASRADDYDSWLRTGMALHGTDTTLLGAWDQWSRSSDKYKEGVCAKKWATFSGNALGLGSLVYWARADTGWTPRPPNGQAGSGRSNGKAGAAPAGGGPPSPGGEDDDVGQEVAVEVAGLRLALTGASKTAGGKVTARVAVRKGGEDVDTLQVAGSEHGRTGAAKLVAFHAGVGAGGPEWVAINVALGKLLVQADRMADRLARQRAARSGDTVFDVVVRFVEAELVPVYRTAEGVWGKDGLCRKQDFLARTPSRLLDAAAAAADAPADFAKLLRLIKSALEVYHTDLTLTLPTAAEAALGPDAGAVVAFRRALCRMLSKRHWEYNPRGGLGRVSLLAMVPVVDRVPKDRWQRVQEGCAFWVRVEETKEGPVRRLGLRFELTEHLGMDLPEVDSHRTLAQVGVPWGVIDPDPPWKDPRVVDDADGTVKRISVLVRALSDPLLETAGALTGEDFFHHLDTDGQAFKYPEGESSSG